MKALEEYYRTKESLKDVTKGGKHYSTCSFMNIAIRTEHFENVKKELIKALGKIELEKIENYGSL